MRCKNAREAREPQFSRDFITEYKNVYVYVRCIENYCNRDTKKSAYNKLLVALYISQARSYNSR